MTTQKEHLEAVNAASAADAKEKAMELRLNKAKADLEELQRVQKDAAGSDTAVQVKYKVRAMLLLSRRRCLVLTVRLFLPGPPPAFRCDVLCCAGLGGVDGGAEEGAREDGGGVQAGVAGVDGGRAGACMMRMRSHIALGA